jgi:hypothetical protein
MITRGIEKTIKEIIAETEIVLAKSPVAKAGITPENFEALKQVVADGYTTPELVTILNDKEIKNRVYADKIFDVYFDKNTIEVLKRYLTRGGSTPGSVKQLDTADTKGISVLAYFRPDCIEAVVLMSNNGIAVYRKGLQFPSVVFCHSAEEAKALYNEIRGAM